MAVFEHRAATAQVGTVEFQDIPLENLTSYAARYVTDLIRTTHRFSLSYAASCVGRIFAEHSREEVPPQSQFAQSDELGRICVRPRAPGGHILGHIALPLPSTANSTNKANKMPSAMYTGTPTCAPI